MVYVDNMKAKFGRLILCHMIADSKEELLQMANKIGVNVKWIQYEGTYKEHFDICSIKRKEAIKLGAKEISWRELGMQINMRVGSPFLEIQKKLNNGISTGKTKDF